MRISNFAAQISGAVYGTGRVLAAKLIFMDGTMQTCDGGHPVSVIGLRQREVSALSNCEELAAPLRATVQTVQLLPTGNPAIW